MCQQNPGPIGKLAKVFETLGEIGEPDLDPAANPGCFNVQKCRYRRHHVTMIIVQMKDYAKPKRPTPIQRFGHISILAYVAHACTDELVDALMTSISCLAFEGCGA